MLKAQILVRLVLTCSPLANPFGNSYLLIVADKQKFQNIDAIDMNATRA